MPRKESTSLGRVQVESTSNSANLVAPARPTRMPTPQRSYRPTVSQDVVNIQQGLGSLTNALARMSAEQLEKENKAQYRLGQRDRLAASEEILNDIPAAIASKTDHYQKGFMFGHGLARSVEDGLELERAYNELSIDGLPTPGQFNKFMQTFLASKLQGADDDYFIQGYMDHMVSKEAELRGRHSVDNYNASRMAALDDFNVGMRGTLNSALTAGASPEDITDTIRSLHDQAGVLRIPHGKVDELAFENLREFAVTHGRTDIFGTGPEDMGVFEHEILDVDNPDQKVAPMASRPAWQKRIFDAQKQVNAAIKTGEGKASQMAIFELSRSIDAMIDNGDYEKAREAARNGVATGLYKAAKGDSQFEKIEKKQREDEMDSLIVMATNAGQGEVAMIAYPETTTQRMTMARDRAFTKEYKKLVQAGDELALKNAMDVEMEVRAQNGLPFKAAFTPINNATAGNPESFLSAYQNYKTLSAEHPAYARKNVAVNKQMEFDLMDWMVKDAGMPVELAMQRLADLDTPEGQKEMEAAYGARRYQHAELIEEKLTTEGGWFSDREDAENAHQVKEMVKRYATRHMILSGGSNVNSALERAIEYVEANSVTVQRPGTDLYDLVWDNGNPLPEDWQAAVNYGSEQLKGLYANHTTYGKMAGFTPMIDPNNKDYVIWKDSETGHGVYNGKGQPVRQLRQELMSDYRQSQLAPADKVELDRLVKRVHATRPRMGGQMVGMESPEQVQAHQDAKAAAAAHRNKRKRKRPKKTGDMPAFDE